MTWAVVALIVAGLSSIVGTHLVRTRRAARFPDVTDEQFLLLMSQRSQASPEAILRERAYLANAIGVPIQKLHPDSRLRDVVSVYPGHQKQIAMNDLADDLFGLAKDRTGRGDGVKLPEKVGDLIALRLSLRS